jgi:hypothetical protein
MEDEVRSSITEYYPYQVIKHSSRLRKNSVDAKNMVGIFRMALMPE